MSDPWVLSSTSGNNVVLDATALSSSYYTWVASNYARFDGVAYLCNWFPLTILVEFAAAMGFRLRLDRWPGRAPTDGPRHWDTTTVQVLDSHGGKYASKADYLSSVRNTVTAQMIGTLNTVAITTANARPGDMLSRDFDERFWHVELITKVSGGVITTEAGSVPAKVPRNNFKNYPSLVGVRRLYQGSPRSWDFQAVLSS